MVGTSPTMTGRAVFTASGLRPVGLPRNDVEPYTGGGFALRIRWPIA